MNFNKKSEVELNDYLSEYYFPLKNLKHRIHEESTEAASRSRNDFQRDHSRILYSSSFRRLQGKMQLLGVESAAFHRNRLTHSLEVAQISRSIAELIAKRTNHENVYTDDIYSVESGSLAHDIGNPPFGHHGERVIHSLMTRDKDGGFEGNAQSLRVLHQLEKKLPNERGLNLSIRTLLSIVKYYVSYSNSEKDGKFIYNSNFETLKSELQMHQIFPRTLDVQIIDLADEIAYAAHDLEDALSLKMFNIDEFIYEIDKELSCSHNSEEFNQLVNNAKKVASKANNYNSSEEYGFLFFKSSN